MQAKILLLASAGAILSLPVLAQDVEQNSGAAANVTTAPSSSGSPSGPVRRAAPAIEGEGDLAVSDLEALELPTYTPPVELPDRARRDPWVVGPLDPVAAGLGQNPWGNASGAFLSALMRRADPPLASRWAHIALRNGLLARTRAPRNVNPVDWVAERAWLLLRMGEADAARMLVAGVDVDRFTPKMFQVAAQAALATADPPALCPLQRGLQDVETRIVPLVDAMCASLTGEPESAAAQIDTARRRGRIGGIDLVLAEKVVGAGADTGRAVTVEWEPVDQLNSWRFGLATATGMALPDNLVRRASPRLRAFQARAPLLSPQERLASARVAAGLGVFSSQALVDLYSSIYDATDPDELPQTDAWQLRLAFVGKDLETRMAAMRRLWGADDDRFQEEASRALTARAASLIDPSADLQEDAPKLIASMLAGGYDRQAARWAPAVRQMDDEYADRSWAMLALAASDPRGLDVSFGRINSFISRDESRGKQRSGLLVAGLLGLGRIDGATADRLNERHGLGIGQRSRWTRVIDAAAAAGQGGTVLVMTGVGLQRVAWNELPPAHLYHALAALSRTGQDYTARMIAAEALART